MKYKIGDKVKIKSLDWYNENKDDNHEIRFENGIFTTLKSTFLGQIMTIELITLEKQYIFMEDRYKTLWTDEMIEGLVEEATKSEDELLDEYEELTDRAFKGGYKKCKSDIELNGFQLPEGYQFVDENGNVINATKIVLEKKPDDKLKLESTKKVREYWSEYARIFIEIYNDEPNECILTHLYTLESYRQKGYGKQALMQAEEIAKKLGCHTAHLKVETDSWMHKWYLRCGYQWYKNADEDYVWLTKNL